MRHLPRDAQFGVKLGQPIGVGGDAGGQELQGHGLVERQIVGAVHLAHAAAAEHRDEAISPGNYGARREAM